MRQAVVSFVLLMVAVSVSEGKRPPYIECQTSEECGKESCCVIGMGRFSIPQCKPRRDVGEICRPYGEPVNTTLSYPDGESVELQGVYYIHCPCMGGLSCLEGDQDDHQCAEIVLDNHLYDYDSSSLEHLSLGHL